MTTAAVMIHGELQRADNPVLFLDGPGSITIGLAEAVPEGSVVGIDLSLIAIEQAQSVAKSKGLNNVEFKTGNSLSLPFPDAHFDVAYCNQLLMHVDDPVDALAEMKRVVKPGGVVATRESLANIWHPSNPTLENGTYWLHRAIQNPNAKGRSGLYLHIYAQQVGFALADIRFSASAQVFMSPDEKSQVVGAMKTFFAEKSLLRQKAHDAGMTNSDLEQVLSALEEWECTPDAFQDWVSQEMICRV